MNFRTLLRIKAKEIFKGAPVRYMSFMDEMVPDVETILKDKGVLPGQDFFKNTDAFGYGLYTGQSGKKGNDIFMHGYGRMNFKNGDWYQGDWVLDSMHGTGCFYYKDKNYGYEGKFDCNRPSEGTFFFGDRRAKIHIITKNNKLSIHSAAFWGFVYTYYEKETSKQKVSQGQKVSALLTELSSLY
jgi:hypothetical protein